MTTHLLLLIALLQQPSLAFTGTWIAKVRFLNPCRSNDQFDRHLITVLCKRFANQLFLLFFVTAV